MVVTIEQAKYLQVSTKPSGLRATVYRLFSFTYIQDNSVKMLLQIVIQNTLITILQVHLLCYTMAKSPDPQQFNA